MADKRLVLAIFPDEFAADNAAEMLKSWDLEKNMSAMGVLVLDHQGKLKTHKMGARSAAKGAGIGLVLAVVAPPSLIFGAIAGSALGAFHHKGLGLTESDRARIGKALSGGKAALGILTADAYADKLTERLTDLGGEVDDFDVSDEALDAVAQTASVEAGAGSGTGTTGST